MFICTKCGKKSLSHAGRTWPGRSLGPCELCGTTDVCHDISSGWDWAWKPAKKKKGKKS